MSLRKLLKLKHELDSLELRIQQWGLKLQSLIPDKEGEPGEPLILKEEHHESHEVNCGLPPKLDELEIEEPLVEPCEVVDEIGEPLCQEENPHLQQELRTILFEERGYDVHFQGCHFHSSSSTSWEASSKQIHAWQGPSSVPLFEFHDKRHFMEFYLNFKVPYPKMMGAIKDQGLGEQPESPHIHSSPKEVQNIHAMVRNFISNDLHQLPSSNSFWPGFVSLTECKSEGQISCTHDQIKA